MNPLFVQADPLSPLPVLGKRLGERVRQCHSRGADSVIVLLDTEKVTVCPGVRARDILREVVKHVDGEVVVVMKHTTLENWLVAAKSAHAIKPALFPNASRVVFAPSRADEVDGQRMLASAMGRGVYSKSRHPAEILAVADIEEMAANSRSFNKFVRVLKAC